jgi:hypothetical protein
MEYGHDAYNGTISTTRGYRVVSSAPVGAMEANRLMESRIERLGKWGDCEAVMVGKAAKTRSQSVTLDLQGEDLSACVDEFGYFSLPLATAAAGTGIALDGIEHVEILDRRCTFKKNVTPAGPPRKVWTTSRGGEFASRAEAILAARRHLDMHVQSRTNLPAERFDARPSVEVFQRSSRTPEAAVSAELRRVKLKLRLEFLAPGARREFDHWLFYGWAAC